MTIHGETIAVSNIEPVVERAPLLGEHREYVLKDLLGIDEREIDQLQWMACFGNRDRHGGRPILT